MSTMSPKIRHGRREGQLANSGRQVTLPAIGLIAKGIDPKQVAVLQPQDWRRIHNSLTKYNQEAEMREKMRKNQEELHMKSKELVKHWGNTIEGQRLKKLQAKKIREEQEEEERKKIDIEEAKLQAQKRKEAIEQAKQQLYYQTDRVKNFHGALLLTEVLKERDAQVEMKQSKANWQKERDDRLLEWQRKNYEDAIKDDLQKMERRVQSAKETADFHLSQIKDLRVKDQLEKEDDVKEGKAIKAQYETFSAARDAIAAQKREDKKQLMNTYKREAELKKEYERREQEKDMEFDKKLRKFVNAKRKMARMRKEKEEELFDIFQERTDRMHRKLEEQMKQKVDDEDDRIARAVAERDAKRLEAEKKENEEHQKTLGAINQHRLDQIKTSEETLQKDKALDRVLLQERVADDKKFQKKQEEEKIEQRSKREVLQGFHQTQIAQKVEALRQDRKALLSSDKKDTEKLVEEEAQFQEYAKKVIEDARKGKRNPYPLVKAAREGPGGGRGPQFEGNAGYRPSYITCDATGVQLPHYLKDDVMHSREYGHVGKSGKRLGFGW